MDWDEMKNDQYTLNIVWMFSKSMYIRYDLLCDLVLQWGK